MDKVIISAAITGAVHTPSMSPHLPITPQQLADEAVAACEAGAAIVHIHVRDPETGKPSCDIELFQETFSDIEQRCNAILSPSTGGGGADTNLEVLKAEMASVNLGSLSGGLFPLAEEERNWNFDWEKPYLEGTCDSVFQNSFKSTAEIVKACQAFGTKPVCEIYDLSMINNLAHLMDRGIMDPGTTKRPLTIEFPMGRWDRLRPPWTIWRCTFEPLGKRSVSSGSQRAPWAGKPLQSRRQRWRWEVTRGSVWRIPSSLAKGSSLPAMPNK